MTLTRTRAKHLYYGCQILKSRGTPTRKMPSPNPGTVPWTFCSHGLDIILIGNRWQRRLTYPEAGKSRRHKSHLEIKISWHYLANFVE